ncbi:MAG: lipopolysaccharide heptosyltransferase II [Candidatus Omnitrophica bacterium]|nr:lipopolysaccharide heptosyltransferase II [Candidatus Omnitrophota bacterium]
MNILQILPELESGGVERGTVDLADALVKSGHKSVVVSGGGRLVKGLEAASSVHYTMPVHRKSLLSVIWCVSKLRKIIERENIDIVHARSRVPAWIAFFATLSTKAELVTTCHGYYSKHFFSAVMGWGKRVIVISQIIGRHMMHDFGVQKEKIRLIYRGVDLNEFKFEKKAVTLAKQKVIGIIGRITPLKGHIHFIKALPGILSEFPQAKALIIGEAPEHKNQYLNELKMLVEDLNLTDKVKFLGNVENIPGILKKLDLLVLSTTTQEAFGRVVIEAGAVGVPVVATKVGGVVEIIEHEKDGLLVEPANAHEIADAAVRLLKDRKLSDECIRNLRKKVEDNFSLEVLVRNTIDLYREVVDKKMILVIKLGALGDAILITPSLRALRQKFPNAQIEVLIKNQFKDVLQLCPYIDGLIILKHKGFFEAMKKITEIKQKGFNFCVDFQNNNLSHMIAFFAGIKQRFGFNNKKLGFLLNYGSKDTMKNCDPVTHQFQVIKSLGIEGNIDKRLELWLSVHDEFNVQEFLKQSWHSSKQMLIGINALGSPRWVSKAWMLESYAMLADMLSYKFNARIVFTGTKYSKGAIDEIIKHTQCRPVNAAGKTSLMELGALIKRCAVLITVDSAPMHIAAALKVPFVALFGPTDPARHLPFAEKSALIRKELSCSGCYAARCFRKNCMREITVEEVYEAAMNLITKE